jgi:DNA-binding LacI/PurR family transcriptional regulator
MAKKAQLRDDAYVERVAKAASVDKRSVVRVLAGLPVKGKAGERILEAMNKEEKA